MILEYLQKAGKYIYGNRILMIVCTLIVFVIVANLLKFVSNIHDEHFVNHQTKANQQAHTAAAAPEGFLATQIEMMKAEKNNKN
jgi:F0F1-type ATP synthase membrane subunit a